MLRNVGLGQTGLSGHNLKSLDAGVSDVSESSRFWDDSGSGG